ncbi:kinase-like domain-containing protein [Mycena galericulata]|nr:kinase-like domain-containing protein [Mycena galericulata]
MSSAEVLAIRERQPRSIKLNDSLDVKNLRQSICDITGNEECVLSKIAEGGFHRIYLATLSAGRKHAKSELIVRVAFDIPDYRNTRKMESEVATINWVKRNTDIPVPTIMFYDPSGRSECADSDDEENLAAVGAPYMIMEKVPGRTLDRMWPNMTQLQRETVVETLAGYTTQLLQTGFPAIGSLYPGENNDTSLGAMIPTCSPWCFRTDSALNSGPWATERDYLLGCIDRELQWISEHRADLHSAWASDPDSNSLEQYTSLLNQLHRRVDTMECLLPGAGPFVLRHPDFNPSNIMVREDDPSVVTAVLDWECTNTAPTWAVAQIPDFLLDRGDEREKDPAERESKTRLRKLFSGSVSDAGSLRGQALLALEEVCQTITTMRKLDDMDRTVSNVFVKLTAAGI